MKLLVLLPFLLTACGPVSPPMSQLYDTYSTFTANVGGANTQGNASLTFDPSGSFIYEAYWAVYVNYNWQNYNCTQAGTWVDLDPGTMGGQVQLTYSQDSCNSPSLTGNSRDQTYTIAGNNFTIGMTLANQVVYLSY